MILESCKNSLADAASPFSGALPLSLSPLLCLSVCRGSGGEEEEEGRMAGLRRKKIKREERRRQRRWRVCFSPHLCHSRGVQLANFSVADISEPFGRLFLPPLPFPFPSTVSPSGADNGFISAATCRWKVPRVSADTRKRSRVPVQTGMVWVNG